MPEATPPKKTRHAREIFTREFLALATINLAMFFGFQMITVGLPVYVAQLGADAFMVGVITSSFTIVATLVRVFAGAVLDRFGRIGAMVTGIALMLCSIIAYAVFPFVGVILGIRLLHGLGWGFGSTATSTVAADIIPKKRFAEGMGYFAMTNAVASALAPALSIFLIQGVGAIYMLGISAGFTLLALVLAVTQAKRLGKHAEHPGPKPPQAASDARDSHAPGGDPAMPPAAPRGLDALFERRALLPSVAMLLVNIGFGTITTFIALHAAAQGVPEITWYFIVYAITTVASRPLIGKVIDRKGYRGPSIFATLFTAATLAFIGISDSLPMFCLAGAFAGLGIGTAMGTFQAMAVATVPPYRRGVATSTYFVFFDLGIAIGSFLAGIIAGFVGYATMFQIIAIFPILGCVFFLSAGKRRLATTRPNAEG